MAIAIDDVTVPSRLLGDEPIALAELVAALSTALDLAEGQPENHAVRSCLIAMRIAEEIGLPPVDRKTLFYATLLKDLGSSSNAAKVSALFGADDRSVKRDLKNVDWSRKASAFSFALGHLAPGASPLQKAMQLAVMARAGESGARKLTEVRYERGAEIAQLIGLPEAAAAAIRHLDEHWNGAGHPDGVAGHEIPLLARIACLAQTVEVFVTTEGLDEAFDVAVARRGTWFDPELVDALLSLRDDRSFWLSTYGPNARAVLSRWEPNESDGGLPRVVDRERLDLVCLGFAQVVDAKSLWTFRHSEAVSEIAVGIAQELGYDAELCNDMRRAGLLHDLGKLGVSNLVLDKPEYPTEEEFAAIRRHPDYSERILRRVANFERFADVASAHHERLDGRGYHRRLPGRELPQEARILAVADVYEALTANRPYRDGFPRAKTLDIMRKDLGTGLCPTVFEALGRWLDKTAITPRVEAQLAAIERAYAG
ncbi:MAG: HD domain-containing protein [Planctomycetaceae bacterium]|nr:HD domain-containing protein [Planctomycetaceae bacterium]